MDTERFDGLTRSLSTVASRRAAASGLVGAALTALLPWFRAEEAEAKRKKKKKKKSKQSPPPSPPSPPDSPPPPPPPPPPAPPTGPGHCDDAGASGAQGARHFAQTFLPPQGSHLTSAQVFLRGNAVNFSLTFQIRTVDGAGVPTATVLGTEIVSNILATGGSDPPRSVVATFDPVVTMTPGELHALSVTGPSGEGYAILVNHGTNPCSDGQLFFDVEATGTFNPLTLDDLVFTVTMV